MSSVSTLNLVSDPLRECGGSVGVKSSCQIPSFPLHGVPHNRGTVFPWVIQERGPHKAGGWGERRREGRG